MFESPPETLAKMNSSKVLTLAKLVEEKRMKFAS